MTIPSLLNVFSLRKKGTFHMVLEKRVTRAEPIKRMFFSIRA